MNLSLNDAASTQDFDSCLKQAIAAFNHLPGYQEIQNQKRTAEILMEKATILEAASTKALSSS